MDKDLKKLQEIQLNEKLKRSARLKRIEADKYSGYADYVALLDDYVAKMLENKKNFNLSTATDAEILRLKLYDRDVWLICNLIRPMIKNFVRGVEEAVEKRKKEDERAKQGAGT